MSAEIDESLKGFINEVVPGGGTPEVPLTIHTDDEEIVWDKTGEVSTVAPAIADEEDRLKNFREPSETSYPYLRISAAYNVPYSDVLTYVGIQEVRYNESGEETWSRKPTVHETELLSRIDENSAWCSAVRSALLIENDRRYPV